MAFTEEDMKRQAEAFAAIKEEFSRLESEEASMRKRLGVPEQDSEIDRNSLPPELLKQLEEAEAAARRAGQARATQVSSEKPASHAGSGRKGAVRV